MRTIRILAACGLLLLGSACSMHVIDIQQGTIITPEMVAQLKPGMTRNQVQFVMGTPTIADPFHHDRWDYLYTLEARGKPPVRHHVVLFFEEDRLVRIEERAPPSQDD